MGSDRDSVMTLEEARTILGVAAETPRKEVRRSYLRQVKQHPPEKDPEGFQRVRAAFELLRGAPTSLPLVLSTAVTPADAEQEPAAEPPDEPSIDPAREDPVVAEVTRRLEALPEEISDAHFEVLATAVEEHPDRPQLYWLWVDLLERTGRSDEIPDVLRRAVEHGHPGFFEYLAADWPQTLTADEIVRAAESGDPNTALAVALELVRRDEPDSVGEMTLGAVQAWIQRFPDFPPPIGRALEIFFRLQAAGRVALARELLRGIEEVVDDFGLGLNDKVVAWLTTAQEMALLPIDFPPGLRAKLAESALREDREIAADALHEFALEFPATAPRVAEQLQRAPHLYDFYGHLLAGSQSSSFSPSVAGLGGGGVLLLVLLVRLLAGGSSDEVPSLPAEWRTAEGFRYSMAETQIRPRCSTAAAGFGSSELCRLAFELLESARGDTVDCDRLTAIHQEILAATSDPTSGGPFALGVRAMDAVQELVDGLCPPDPAAEAQVDEEPP